MNATHARASVTASMVALGAVVLLSQGFLTTAREWVQARAGTSRRRGAYDPQARPRAQDVARREDGRCYDAGGVEIPCP